jgi:hypothetical protein
MQDALFHQQDLILEVAVVAVAEEMLVMLEALVMLVMLPHQLLIMVFRSRPAALIHFA